MKLRLVIQMRYKTGLATSSSLISDDCEACRASAKSAIVRASNVLPVPGEPTISRLWMKNHTLFCRDFPHHLAFIKYRLAKLGGTNRKVCFGTEVIMSRMLIGT